VTMDSSCSLREYNGPNPFAQSQARTYPSTPLLSEFYATTVYWSRFNSSHEILLGTRGSGKTVILRMLAYSNLRRLKDPRAQELATSRKFLAFYTPLHLEWLKSLPGKDVPPGQKLGYFQFALNCRAAMSLLEEIEALIDDIMSQRQDSRASIEVPLVEDLARAWGLRGERDPVRIADLRWELTLLHMHQPFWRDDSLPALPLPYLARDALLPLVEVLPRVGERLGLDSGGTTWMACLDEAEFLPEDYQACLNSFLRSEKQPLVAKVATLPTRHLTLRTLEPGIYIEPRGNDFSYRAVDLPFDSEDFRGVTNQLCRCRLSGTPAETDSLEGFLPPDEFAADLRSRFLSSVGENGPTGDGLHEAIVEFVSRQRQDWVRERELRGLPVDKAIDDKYAPVYYVRRLRELDRQGNRQVGWFSGPTMIRRIADGNPRRFIDLMNGLFEEARAHPLSNRRQHRMIVDFCDNEFLNAGGLPEVGHVTKEIIDAVGRSLEERVHSGAAADAGCGFLISEELLENPLFLKAFKMGIDYLHFVVRSGIKGPELEAPIRLSYLHAVKYWLPMRTGQETVLRSSMGVLAALFDPGVYTEKQAKTVVKQLQLKLVEFGEAGHKE
jgi:hypothetical protein